MKVATDIGGTFTDLVAIDENGSLILEKAHTTPPNFDQGVMDVLEKSGVDMKSMITHIKNPVWNDSLNRVMIIDALVCKKNKAGNCVWCNVWIKFDMNYSAI